MKLGLTRASKSSWGDASEEARRLAEAMLTQFLPDTRYLCNIVLRMFQSTELSRVPAEIQAVCAVFGIVVNIDGSSAPLYEVRPYHLRKSKEVDRIGCAMCATGLFNVPACLIYIYIYIYIWNICIQELL